MNTSKKILAKRTADFLEKLAVAGMALGLFQGRVLGTFLGLIFLLVSYYLSIKEAKL